MQASALHLPRTCNLSKDLCLSHRTWVLNERAHAQVGTDSTRLKLLCKLAVAVVNGDNDIGVLYRTVTAAVRDNDLCHMSHVCERKGQQSDLNTVQDQTASPTLDFAMPAHRDSWRLLHLCFDDGYGLGDVSDAQRWPQRIPARTLDVGHLGLAYHSRSTEKQSITCTA